jgi:hypothetical protein
MKRNNLVGALTVIILFAFAGMCSGSDAPPEIANLEAQILSARRSIKTGHFMISRQYHPRPRAGMPPVIENQIETWLDDNGDRRRQDITDSQRVAKICLVSDAIYEITYNKATLGLADRTTWPGVSIKDPSKVDPKKLTFQTFNPLILMLAPSNYESTLSLRLNFIIGSPLRDRFAMAATTWEGKEAQRISFTMTDLHIDIEYDVVPSLSYNIVRMSALSAGPGAPPLGVTLNAKLQEIAAGLWFPKTVNYEERADEKVTQSEILTIRADNINRSPNSETFTLAALIPQDKTVIHDLRPTPEKPEKVYIWDARSDDMRVLAKQDLRDIEISKVRITNSTRKYYLYGSGALILLGVVCWYFYQRNKRTQ